MRRRFLVERFENGTATLRGDDAQHLGRVLRAEPGQLYELSDGEAVWLARSERIERDSVEFKLIELLPTPQTRLFVSLLLSVVKFDRFEWALEKATELGVGEVVPLAADRSERGLLLAAPKRAARWAKILHESAQQARRIRIPVLREATKSHDAFAVCESSIKVMLSERGDSRTFRQVLEPIISVSAEPKPLTIALAIGPEGGWTDREFSAARKARFAESSLGPNILRTETSVCAALASIQYAFAATAQATGQVSDILG